VNRFEWYKTSTFPSYGWSRLTGRAEERCTRSCWKATLRDMVDGDLVSHGSLDDDTWGFLSSHGKESDAMQQVDSDAVAFTLACD
jgi:hypothetical protein